MTTTTTAFWSHYRAIYLKEQDKRRRARLRAAVEQDLTRRGVLDAIEGMNLDANVVQGAILSWVWRVKLTDGAVLAYHLDNHDGAAVLLDGEVVEG